MVILGIILFLTIFEAVHEGLHLNGKIAVSGVIEAVKLLGILALIPFLLWYDEFDGLFRYGEIWKFWRFFVPQYVIGWVFIRFAIFDWIFNLSARLPMNYVGNSKYIDRYLFIKINRMWGNMFWNWVRPIALLVGLSLILKI